jgi:methyl-accepting chemotaxis protein
MGSSFRAFVTTKGIKRVGFRRSLATKLALQVGPPAIVLALLAVWLLRLPKHAAVMSAVVAVGVLAAYAITLRALLSAKLSRLTTAMEHAERGDFIPRIDVSGEDELAELARRFNAMLAKITDMNVSQIESQRELELIQNELRLKAQLEAQKKQIEETNRRLEVRLRELTLLFDITRSINSTLELGELIKLITEMVGVALGFQEFAVLMLDEPAGELVVAATYGFPEQTDVDGLRLKLGVGAPGRAAQQGEIVLVNDVSTEPD